MSLYIYLIWFLLIGVEIFRNWSIIAVRRRRPTYWWSTVLRIVAGFIFWWLVKLVARPDTGHLYALPIMMVFTFWWVFDYGLNMVRMFLPLPSKETYWKPIWDKPFYYLNPDGSWLDKFQCKHPHPYAWFWFKLFLAMGSVSLFEKGLQALSNYPY